MSSIRDEIAKNLLYYRKKAGLTQKELAEKLGVKNTAVSNWESGNNSVDIETLFLACNVLNVSLSDMYGKYSGQTKECPLTPDEEQLVADYRDASEEIRGAAAKMLSDSAAANRKEKDTRSQAG